MNHYAKREQEKTLFVRIMYWCICVVLLLMFVLLFWVPSPAQERSNTYYAAQFAGADAGTKIANAQASCSPNTSIPCIIVIDAILAGWPQGTQPARCSNCTWIDYRTVGTVGFTGLALGKIFNRFILGNSRYPETDAGIHMAAADCVSQGGGTIILPDGDICPVTSQLVLGNTTTKPACELEIGSGATIDATGYTAGTDVILVGDTSAIRGHNGLLGASSTFRPSQIKFGSTSNFNALIAPADRSGAQEGLMLSGFAVVGNASATCTSAIFDIQGVFINTRISDVNTAIIPCRVLRVRPGISFKVLSDLVFDNDNFDASATAGGEPVSIEGATASEIGNLTFVGGGIQHPGPGLPLLNIDGATVNGGVGVHNLKFYNVHFEGNAAMAASAISIADASHITFDSLPISGAPSTTVVNVSQTGAGRTHDISIAGLRTSSAWTKTINNAINGFNTASDIGYPGYQFGGGSAGAGGSGATFIQSIFTSDNFNTTTNCTSAVGTCSSAAAGAVTIAAAATTVTVSTTAVTANSEIKIQEQPANSTRLGVTCNTTTGRTYTVTAITPGASFVVTASAAPTTNPACLTYAIEN